MTRALPCSILWLPFYQLFLIPVHASVDVKYLERVPIEFRNHANALTRDALSGQPNLTPVDQP